MISFPMSRTMLAGIALMSGLWAFCGCDDKYPADMKYPLRDDLILNLQKNDPTPENFFRPGQLFDALGNPASTYGVVNPADLDANFRSQLDAALNTRFGTPFAPKVTSPSEDFPQESVEELQLDAKTLARGSELYRLHCLHCHGLSGNGRGPTAPWVSPHPRDYRPGRFKFTSSSQGEGERKPRRADLERTLLMGIEGTTMPSFALLPAEDVNALISYVIHLSLRGETEIQVMSLSADYKGDVEYGADEWLTALLSRWMTAQESTIVPYVSRPEGAALDKSVASGKKLFTSKALNCLGCHADYGRRIENFRWDAWGTVVRPANLTTGIYRGGRRPIDLYWRINGGVNGTGMPELFPGLRPTGVDESLLSDIQRLDATHSALLLSKPAHLAELFEAADKLPEPLGKELKSIAPGKEVLDKLKGEDKFNAESSKLRDQVQKLSLSAKDVAGLKAVVDVLPFNVKEDVYNNVGSLRNWDLVNYLYMLPYPEMRKKYDIVIH